jgi:hypothetical protein
MGEEVVGYHLVQHVTKAIKAEIGRQLGAQPLLGDAASGDWHARADSFELSGGALDLQAIAKVSIEARDSWMQEK